MYVCVRAKQTHHTYWLAQARSNIYFCVGHTQHSVHIFSVQQQQPVAAVAAIITSNEIIRLSKRTVCVCVCATRVMNEYIRNKVVYIWLWFF